MTSGYEGEAKASPSFIYAGRRLSSLLYFFANHIGGEIVAIPWVQLAKHAPAVLSLTRDLMKRTAKGANRPVDEGTRIEALERDLHRQAEALHALAGQVEGLTSALASLRRILLTAVFVSIGALLTALAALISILLR